MYVATIEEIRVMNHWLQISGSRNQEPREIVIFEACQLVLREDFGKTVYICLPGRLSGIVVGMMSLEFPSRRRVIRL